MKIELAKTLAKLKHTGQKYGDKDYFDYHICGVVDNALKLAVDYNLIEQEVENLLICAYIHDLVEDTDVTLETVTNIFGLGVGNIISWLTRRKGIPYKWYLSSIADSGNIIAILVKIADAQFNRDNSLLEGNQSRADYYQANIDYITSNHSHVKVDGQYQKVSLLEQRRKVL